MNPVSIINGRINFVWFKPTTSETFAIGKKGSAPIWYSIDSNNPTSKFDVSGFASKPNLNFDIVPNNWKSFVNTPKSYIPSRVPSCVRGTIDHFTFKDWQEIYHRQLQAPPNIKDCSLCWHH
eukprot:TRINITY_DN2459_c0_g1_i1.p1 TRINITY_DN2459_c0_g1~~TRINITY_DN2459_c0_g1_i1.p1  ORF type:complete len:122 (-),score=18.16 TRINITY_DN2459_c0_g1_i1:79-444(-)